VDAATAKATTALLLSFVVGCAGESSTPERRDYEYMESALVGLRARFLEATDTAVRDNVLVSVYCSVVHGQPVPKTFGMFSPAGDRAVRSRVLAFVRRNRRATSGLTTDERIEALWGDSWGEDVSVQPSACNGI
jgi:hypothetical protein